MVFFLRQGVSQPTTAYVNPVSGSNSNSGLTPSSPKLTPQAGWDTLIGLDLANQTGTLQLQDGSYTTGLSVQGIPVGNNNLSITGNATTPGAVIWNATSGNSIDIGGGLGTQVRLGVSNMDIGSVAGAGVSAESCLLQTDNIRWRVCNLAHLVVEHQAFYIVGSNADTILGGAAYHHFGASGGILAAHGQTININASITFGGAFVYMSTGAFYFGDAMTFNNPGNVTGQRFQCYGGGISTGVGNGQGLHYFPGTIEGDFKGGGSAYDRFVYDGFFDIYNSDQTLLLGQRYNLVDATGGNKVMTLPVSTANNTGMIFEFAKLDASGNTVTVKDSAGNTVSVLAAQNNWIKIISYTGNWQFMGKNF